MTEVVRFPGITRLDLDPDVVLREALEKLEGVVIIGYAKDGAEYFASSYADGETAVWLLERAKFKLMQIADGDD